MKTNILTRLLKVLPVLSFCAAAVSAEYPDAVQVLIDDGLNIEARFDAPGGLVGYVGRDGGHAVTLYLTPDGEHVVVGTMNDGFGQDLSAKHIRTWLPEIDLSSAWQQLEGATWIAEGSLNPKRIVYVFTDPNCGYCIEFRKKAVAYLDRGIQLRHVMVGVIEPSSLAKAASVVGAENPADRLSFHESQYPRDWLETPSNIPDQLRKRIEANNKLMETLSVAATPSVFYRDRRGEVRKIVGLPDDTALSEAVFRQPD